MVEKTDNNIIRCSKLEFFSGTGGTSCEVEKVYPSSHFQTICPVPTVCDVDGQYYPVSLGRPYTKH